MTRRNTHGDRAFVYDELATGLHHFMGHYCLQKARQNLDGGVESITLFERQTWLEHSSVGIFDSKDSIL